MKEFKNLSFKELKTNFYQERNKNNFEKRYKEMFSMGMPDIIQRLEVYQEPFNRRNEVIKEGDLVLGALLMANELLFQRTNDYDCPAVFLYSYDEYFEENPDELRKLGHELFYLRTVPEEILLKSPEKKEIADMLNAEATPEFNYKLSEKLTYGRTVYMTTVVVIRREIENGALENSFYPLLVKDGVPSAVILDYKCYDTELKQKIKVNKYKKVFMSVLAIGVTLWLKSYCELNIAGTVGFMLFLLECIWKKIFK